MVLEVKNEIDLNRQTSKADIVLGKDQPASDELTTLPEDLSAKFEVLIKSTISAFEDYECEKSNFDKENAGSNSTNSGSKQTNWFERFNSIYNKLLTNIRHAKQTQYFKFMNVFCRTNSNIIKLYEFASKMLSLSKNPSQEDHQELLITFIKRTIEMIHILITNQNEENEDDESSIMCCSHLAESFNFTSYICDLLLNYSLNNTEDKKPSNIYNTPLLNEKSYRLAFSVLNKLSLDNKLFAIDSYVKQFIELSVRKILDGNVSQTNYIQFLSNTIRNNKAELEPVFHASDNYYSLCRRLLSIVQGDNLNLMMTSLTIVTILGFDETFLAKSKGLIANDQIITNINTAISILCASKDDEMFGNCRAEQPKMSSSMSLCTQKVNTLNFLIELFRRDKVIKALEINEDYSNLFMFKLNQLLIENSNKTKSQSCTKTVFSNFSIKIFQILCTLSQNSEKLSNNIFQIIFNTRKFVEQKSKNNEYDLSKKLQELVLNNSSTFKRALLGKKRTSIQEDQYEILIEYYFRSTRMSLTNDQFIDNPKKSKSSHCIENMMFYSNLFQYLYVIFQKNKPAESREIEKNIGQFLEIYIENFNQLYCWYCEQKNSEYFATSDKKFYQILFYILNTIDLILNKYGVACKSRIKFEPSALVRKLYDIIEMNHLNSVNESSTSWSMISDNLVLDEQNILITCRLIIRLLLLSDEKDSKIEKELKENVLAFFKSKKFMMLLSYGQLSPSTEHLTEMAFDLTFEINRLSSSTCFKYLFPNELFIEMHGNIKRELFASGSNSHMQHTPFSSDKVAISNSKSLDQGLQSDLFELYERKLKEKNDQEMKLSELLNQRLVYCFNLENENLKSRNSLREYSRKLMALTKDKECFETRLTDSVRTIQDLKATVSELNEEKKKLKEEFKKNNDQYETLKQNYEQLEKDNDESITNLQQLLSNETIERKSCQHKLKEIQQKLAESEKVKQSSEQKVNDLETKLKEKSSSLDEKTAEWNDLLKKMEDYEKILSFVKQSYKG